MKILPFCVLLCDGQSCVTTGKAQKKNQRLLDSQVVEAGDRAHYPGSPGKRQVDQEADGRSRDRFGSQHLFIGVSE